MSMGDEILHDVPFVNDKLPTNVPKDCGACGRRFLATNSRFCGLCQLTTSVLFNHYTNLYMRWKVLYE